MIRSTYDVHHRHYFCYKYLPGLVKSLMVRFDFLMKLHENKLAWHDVIGMYQMMYIVHHRHYFCFKYLLTYLINWSLVKSWMVRRSVWFGFGFNNFSDIYAPMYCAELNGHSSWFWTRNAQFQNKKKSRNTLVETQVITWAHKCHFCLILSFHWLKKT